jgi:hypothetical protein
MLEETVSEKRAENTDDATEANGGFLSQSVEYVLSKIRGIMGVEFAEFGGIRRLSKINLVHPTFLPSMLVDVQDRVQATLVRQLRQAITGDPDK